MGYIIFSKSTVERLRDINDELNIKKTINRNNTMIQKEERSIRRPTKLYLDVLTLSFLDLRSVFRPWKTFTLFLTLQVLPFLINIIVIVIQDLRIVPIPDIFNTLLIKNIFI